MSKKTYGVSEHPRRRKTDHSVLPDWLPERWYRDVWLVIITVLVLLIAWKTYSVASGTANNQRSNTAALCALRDDLKARLNADAAKVRSSKAYLVTHPHGIPGISAALIRQSIAQQEHTVAGERRSIQALGLVRCHP